MLTSNCMEIYPESNSHWIEENNNFNVEDLNDLRAKFRDWLYKSLDYGYYSPVKSETDKEKYPVVIFIHGIWHWWTKMSQVNDSFFPYMTSDIIQAKFQEKWAHIILPRTPLNVLWILSSDKVQWILEDYVWKNADHVDEKQIVIMWTSAGSNMIWRLLAKNPNFYSRAVLACPPVIPTNKNLEKMADIPLRLVSAKKDPVVLYPTQKLLREKIKNTTNVPDKCRWTIFPWDVYHPDGSLIKYPHYLSYVITSDFIPFNIPNYERIKYDWKNYPGTITTTASWEKIPTQWIINWTQNVRSDEIFQLMFR